jgi:hypothetical protein
MDNVELDVSDCLAKVSCPTDYFNNKFQTPHIAIDESVIKLHGREFDVSVTVHHIYK